MIRPRTRPDVQRGARLHGAGQAAVAEMQEVQPRHRHDMLAVVVPGVVVVGIQVVEVLHADAGARHPDDDGDVTEISGTGDTGGELRDATHLRAAVDPDAGALRGGRPGLRVSEPLSLVAVLERDVQVVVDPPGDEAGALALEELPW